VIEYIVVSNLFDFMFPPLPLATVLLKLE
jgi:hypothetical protein